MLGLRDANEAGTKKRKADQSMASQTQFLRQMAPLEDMGRKSRSLDRPEQTVTTAEIAHMAANDGFSPRAKSLQ